MKLFCQLFRGEFFVKSSDFSEFPYPNLLFFPPMSKIRSLHARIAFGYCKLTKRPTLDTKSCIPIQKYAHSRHRGCVHREHGRLFPNPERLERKGCRKLSFRFCHRKFVEVYQKERFKHEKIRAIVLAFPDTEKPSFFAQ